MSRKVFAFVLGSAFCALAAALPAQDVVLAGQVHGTPLPPAARAILAKDPTAFQFRRAMMSRLRHAKAARAQMGPNALASGLSLSIAREAGEIVSGTEHVVVLPIRYANTTQEPWATSTLQQKLFDGPYSPRTLTQLYTEMSRGQLTMTGIVFPWTTVASADTVYEGTDNGFSGAGIWMLLKQTLDIADKTIDFSQYDGDHDGYVDLVSFVQPETGGECGSGSKNMWSHRWVIEGAAGQAKDTTGAATNGYLTNDGVYISDYVLEPALNCGSSDPIDIGVFAHEFGHALGLPDLYATADPEPNSGIGEWGLMGAGNWNIPISPSHMSAWSKMELGWAPVRTLTTSQHVTMDPIETTGDIVKLPIAGTDEYFLLENRERLGSDAYLLGTGLLIWHIDSGVVQQRWPANTIENETNHKGVDLEEASGIPRLDSPGYRGSAADIWPGTSGATSFTSTTTPNSNAYAQLKSGIAITNIAVSSGGQVSFDLTVTATQPLVLSWGDVNGDGKIELADANSVYDCLLGLSCPTGDARTRADVDADGALTARDALIIHSYAVGVDVTKFRVGTPITTGSASTPVPAPQAAVTSVETTKPLVIKMGQP